MPVKLHWFLPTNGDSRSDLSLGNAVGVRGSRIGQAGGSDRAPDVGYIGQIARSAEQLGFDAALTPTSSWCEDAWVMTAALTQVTERFRFLVAFRPGLTSPTVAAQMAATFQRLSGGRLLLNVVTGGDDREQHRFGDSLSKDERYARAAEFLTIVRRLWEEESVDFAGEHYTISDAQIIAHPVWPELYFGGSSAAAVEVGAAHADVYLTWGEPPQAVAEKIARVRERAAELHREPRFGIRLHVITRETSAEAWAEADRLLAGLSPEQIERSQAVQRSSQSEGQRRMTELHDGRTDSLEIYPNLWAGVGLVRGAPERRWSAATTRSATGSPSTTSWESTSSSSPAIRTWRRPIGSAKAWSPSCAAVACSSQKTANPWRSEHAHRSHHRGVALCLLGAQRVRRPGDLDNRAANRLEL